MTTVLITIPSAIWSLLWLSTLSKDHDPLHIYALSQFAFSLLYTVLPFIKDSEGDPVLFLWILLLVDPIRRIASIAIVFYLQPVFQEYLNTVIWIHFYYSITILLLIILLWTVFIYIYFQKQELDISWTPTPHVIEYFLIKKTSIDSCPICDEEVKEGFALKACGHLYHKECIEEWLIRKPNCPLCRRDIRDIRLFLVQ